MKIGRLAVGAHAEAGIPNRCLAMNRPDPETGDTHDPALARLLRQWSVPDTPPPGFAREVWRRIDRSSRTPASAGPAGFWGNLLAALRDPRAVAAGMALVALLGTGAGVLKGQARAEQLSDALQGLYVQSIDPFSHGAR